MASAQISIYPLRQERLDKAVAIVGNALLSHGLEPEIGAMSTLASGESDAIFAALAAAYKEAAQAGPVVMTVTVSNTCPVPG